MDKWAAKLLWLLIWLQYVQQLNCVVLKFTNISCESKDLSLVKVEYCYIKQRNKIQNSMSLRFLLFNPIHNNVGLMVKRTKWMPFLYEINIDMCRFMKNRYNSIAKLAFSFLEGFSNINHSCPYTREKFLTIDDLPNTHVSGKLRGIPLSKGYYAIFTRWSWENVSRAETNIYFEIVHT